MHLGAQMLRDFSFIGPRSAGFAGRGVPGGQHYRLQQGCGAGGGFFCKEGGHFSIQFAKRVQATDEDNAEADDGQNFYEEQDSISATKSVAL